ncbi:dehydrogenase/reductase SDR family member on chromosome X-like [Loxodonta africana]|uniref:dehydrogenase/reductase SDR family member on chromosome X-like n=1 Tax=Loxodonta africana TaxID=9785 RepID=UPI0030D0AFC1
MSPLCAARAAVRVYAAGAAVILAQLLRRLRGALPEPVFPPQPDRVAIVTGGTDGIGYATAKHLARLGMHVVIAGNNERKSQEAVRTIKEETLNNKVAYVETEMLVRRALGFEKNLERPPRAQLLPDVLTSNLPG